jgi:hypothetical protein
VRGREGERERNNDDYTIEFYFFFVYGANRRLV